VYHDGKDETDISRDDLVRVLSTGERRALYLLNVIFDIETRRKNGQETLVIVDDIADSFDYQNKYAIIQYLHDNAQDGLFKQIIMTHNFDFFRTIVARFIAKYDRCLMATRDHHGVSLAAASGVIGDAFKETGVDYAQLHKAYEAEPMGPGRYSPPKVTSTTKTPIYGEPVRELVSTSYVERNNLNIRMGVRRCTRLTNAFSKKLENHGAATALHFAHYNFVRVHKTVRCSPAMAAGVSKTLWSMGELVDAALAHDATS
jgi:energy-coupling factor transporter ATP-binding protein EcfA2